MIHKGKRDDQAIGAVDEEVLSREHAPETTEAEQLILFGLVIASYLIRGISTISGTGSKAQV